MGYKESSYAKFINQLFAQDPFIKEEMILRALHLQGKDEASLTFEDLLPFDQFHTGGVKDNELLAKKGQLRKGMHVLDVCCGLGGPARYIAKRFGCKVKGLDLTFANVQGAVNLTRRVGLASDVEFVLANALEIPFRGETFDAVWSQGAWLLIPDKGRLLRECNRVLKRKGKLLFHDDLKGSFSGPIGYVPEEIAFFISFNDYLSLIEQSGFTLVEAEEDAPYAMEYLASTLQGLKGENRDLFLEAAGPQGYQAMLSFVGTWLENLQEGKVSHGRFIAQKGGK